MDENATLAQKRARLVEQTGKRTWLDAHPNQVRTAYTLYLACMKDLDRRLTLVLAS